MKRFPWWCSVLLAIVAYYGCRYGIVELLGEDHRLIDFGQLLAPITAMGFLLLAGKQLYDGEETEHDEQEEKQENNTPPNE